LPILTITAGYADFLSCYVPIEVAANYNEFFLELKRNLSFNKNYRQRYISEIDDIITGFM